MARAKKTTDIDAEDAAAAQAGAALRRQAVFWLLFFVAFLGFLYVFRSILLPFVAGMALAYFLDPVADRLERMGLSRLTATIVILVGFIVAFLLALMVVVPVLATQLTGFIERLPSLVASLQNLIGNFDPEWIRRVLGTDPQGIREGVNTLLTQGAGFLSTLAQSIWSSGKALVDIAGLFVVTPVVAFYMLLDWDHMVARVDGWIPRDHLGAVREIARDIDSAVAGFIRGQGTVCLALGIFYAIGLTAVGLNFGLLIGLVAGLISFIPYIGSLVGLAVSIGVALVQFWPDWIWIAAVAAVFFSGQFLEGNILQPKLVGDRVGLHPVWLMFALFAFGMLFGFVGLLIAVPAAAAVGVIARFGLKSYLASPVYRGHSPVAGRDGEG
ncbi:MAG: AI-2E family transporter [Zhengella sp.]|uniref:AI-2E family transporter n=1 Tax=Zhengella sp. TaxID=2282762 RepID=UPI001D6D570F|nr:AI-2E family transporter [Notoacmeibacter sp.]MCC0028036.1 AI-2E family transporter [Brucellaceae bacterium]